MDHDIKLLLVVHQGVQSGRKVSSRIRMSIILKDANQTMETKMLFMVETMKCDATATLL